MTSSQIKDFSMQEGSYSGAVGQVYRPALPLPLCLPHHSDTAVSSRPNMTTHVGSLCVYLYYIYPRSPEQFYIVRNIRLQQI